MHTWAVGRRRGARGVGLFSGGLFIPWRACGGSHGVYVHRHTSCVCFIVFQCFLCFFVCALRLGGLFPLMLSATLATLACTFSLPPPWCVSRSFSLPACHSLSLGPVRQRKDGGMWAFGGWARSSCNILYPRWHPVRCGCVLRCAAYNIPVFALVSTCVRTVLTLRAIPWCACPRRWRLRCACGDRPVCCVPTP